MHIVGGRAQAQSQHYFNRSESQVGVRVQQAPTQPAPSAPRPAVVTTPATTPNHQSSSSDSTCEAGYDKELSLLKLLVEAMSGKQINTLSVDAQSAGGESTTAAVAAAPTTNGRVLSVAAIQISEDEITQVSFAGQFSTADGGQISLNLQYSLERHYSATSLSANVSSNATDPLVLNFNGLGVALDSQRTEFDLNSDNQLDVLPTLRPGSAYLALDRNNDGTINNGSELFGPASGSGYGELAQWDSDNNGFIDEADTVFSQLMLFRPGEALQTLADKDVGAIFLGHAASPARLTDTNNQSLGQLRATGFYLTNAGDAGLVQELDLVV